MDKWLEIMSGIVCGFLIVGMIYVAMLGMAN